VFFSFKKKLLNDIHHHHKTLTGKQKQNGDGRRHFLPQIDY